MKSHSSRLAGDRFPTIMKIFRATWLVILATLTLGAFGAPFEGRIAMRITEGKKTTTATFYCKGDLMRIESSESDEGYAVFDMASKTMTMIMPSQKMYMVMNAGAHAQPTAKSDPPVKTGNKEKILGYECDEYTVTDGKKVTTFWGARGLGVFHSMMRGGPGGPPPGPSALEKAAEAEGVFPLRTIETNARGKEVSRTEVTSVEPGAQPDSLFMPPEGFQKFEMPNMGSMMGR